MHEAPWGYWVLLFLGASIGLEHLSNAASCMSLIMHLGALKGPDTRPEVDLTTITGRSRWIILGQSYGGIGEFPLDWTVFEEEIGLYLLHRQSTPATVTS